MHSGVVSPEVTYGMTRVIGSSMARIASALIDAVSARADGRTRPAPTDDERRRGPRADRQPGRTASCRCSPSVLEQVWRRHLQAAARRRLLRGDAEDGPGLVVGLRRPGRLHRPGPAGERRGAGRGGRPVRAARLRRRGGRRRPGREDDRRRGDVPRRRPGRAPPRSRSGLADASHDAAELSRRAGRDGDRPGASSGRATPSASPSTWPAGPRRSPTRAPWWCHPSCGRRSRTPRVRASRACARAT